MEYQGLSAKEAAEKLKEYGYNEIKEVLTTSPLQILVRQVRKNFVIYLLATGAVISLFVGKDITAYSIATVILILVAVGFFQEYRAEKAIKALKRMIMPTVVIIRDGKEREIDAKFLVPGDIVSLKAGEKIPADGVVLSAKDLSVNEATLTGESAEVKKVPAFEEENPQKENLVFMGTFVTNGKALVKVVRTGMSTEFGKIAGLISSTEKELPLQVKVNNIAKYMAIVGAMVAVLTGFIMLTRELPFSYPLLTEVLIVVIALCVASFPEGFPVVLITTLASGAYRMAKKNVIVNRMSIIETLGETTVVCSDKTGTITTGEMTVRKIFAAGSFFDVTGVGYEGIGKFIHNGREVSAMDKGPLRFFLKAIVLCNDAKIERKGTDHEYEIIGTPTEGALLIAAAKEKIFQEDLKCTRLEEKPFNSERKLKSILCEENSQNFVFSLGATEILLSKCTRLQHGEKVVKLTREKKKALLKIISGMTKDSLRTIGSAYKISEGDTLETLEEDLIFLGIAGMEDPPREEVKRSIELCTKAGIKVKMITGDNKETAVAIGKQIGLEGEVLVGDEIDKLSPDQLTGLVTKTVIFARVKPEHKLKIVKALKSNREVVTMTGDGVNDAPALKEAQIGVAMGRNGTDVTREVADLILKDDKFSTIVTAISEGRTIFNNIQKFAVYQLSINFAQISLIFLGVVFGFPLPLVAMQILFINLLSDEITAITLGFNPASLDVMEVKPRKRPNILNPALITMLIISGSIMSLASLGMFYLALNVFDETENVARTVAFLTIVLFGIANAFNFRSFRTPFFKLPVLSNKYLATAGLVALSLTIIVIYTPLNRIFETAPINIFYWLACLMVAFSVILVFDLLKLVNSKTNFLDYS